MQKSAHAAGPGVLVCILGIACGDSAAETTNGAPVPISSAGEDAGLTTPAPTSAAPARGPGAALEGTDASQARPSQGPTPNTPGANPGSMLSAPGAIQSTTLSAMTATDAAAVPDAMAAAPDAVSTAPGAVSTAPPPPSPAKTCGGGGGPNGGPADLFPCDSTWYKDVSGDAVSPSSDSVIAGIDRWGAGGQFMIDTSILFLHDDGSAPLANFSIDYTDESNIVPVPIPPGGAVEAESGYTCTGNGDCHLIVIQDSTKRLFELYAATDNGNGTWHAAQESVWDLTRSYGPEERGLGCTSADAAGLSVMAGLIGVGETVSGDIRHALRFILPNSKIRRGPSFIAPASHGTSATTSASGPPFGTRLRLKASFDETRIASSGGRAIVRALKKYGMLLADGGEYALTAEDDRFEKTKDPSMTWQGILDPADLAAIAPQDFEVVDFGAVQNQGDCVLLP